MSGFVKEACRSKKNFKTFNFITLKLNFMPISASAKKSLRVSHRKRIVNDRRRKTMKESVKEITKLVKDGKKDEAKKLLPKVYKAIDKATKKGVIKLNTASRRKSKMSKMTK